MYWSYPHHVMRTLKFITKILSLLISVYIVSHSRDSVPVGVMRCCKYIILAIKRCLIESKGPSPFTR